MKQFWAFVHKEFIHIRRDIRTLIILLSMPAILIILFGFAISNEIKNAPVVILDKSKDDETSKIINKLLSSGYFEAVETIESNSEINDIFKKGKVKLAIVFEQDFSNHLNNDNVANIQLISDATDPNTANTLVNYAQAVISGYMAENYPSAGNFNIDVKMRYNPEMKSSFLFVPGLITILMMLIAAMMTSLSLTREREFGSMELLLASPLNPLQIIVAKVIPYLLIASIDIIIILVLGYTVFGVHIKGSLLLLFFESTLFIIMALSLGILISTIAKSQQVALMISLMGLMLPTILLSDFIFPISNMPWWLQLISNIIPPRWFNVIIKSIMLKGSGIELIWKETLIIIGFTLLFLGLSIKKFKVRLA
ncbi:MAG: ABC transporter permease [Candidatus Kapabacteria bacterium]|nr:ABC transporter permease [Candidatus Kapabacteria bacterium]